MRSILVLAILMMLAAASSWNGSVRAASTTSIGRDGHLEVAGRKLQCGSVRNVLDRRLPSEGAAGPGAVFINPRLFNQQPEVVRLFVFHHECGHHHVGGSELKADCWAVERGVRDDWLDRKGLGQVCRSFDNAPETPTHPSGRQRCRHLDQCFATASAARQVANPVPKLLKGPTLVANGTLRPAATPPARQAGPRPPSAFR